MARRSYNQHCGLAVALDVVSQRWALLVIRDLRPGPRRFSDLFAGLPGISTDMLAERLRELDQAGAVEQVALTHPVPATVYQLPDRGRDLARIGGELARWGAPLLPPVAESPLRRNARWAVQSFASRYRGKLAGVYHFILDDAEELTLELHDDRAVVSYGPPTASTTMRLTCTSDDLFAAVAGSISLNEPEQVEGDTTQLAELLAAIASTLTDAPPA